MKVNLELDLTPEEMRRLFGLPDVSPINNRIIEKLGEQVEKGLDGTLLRNLTQTMIKGGGMGVEAYQSFLGAISRMSRPREGDNPSAPPGQQSPATEAAQAPATRDSGAHTGGATK